MKNAVTACLWLVSIASRVSAQTAVATAFDQTVADASNSCAGFTASATSLQIEQQTRSSAKVTASSQRSTFWITDGYGTVLAMQSGAATERTLSWDPQSAPLYLIARTGCSGAITTGLESLPTPSWSQKFADIQNAWDGRTYTTATGLAPGERRIGCDGPV